MRKNKIFVTDISEHIVRKTDGFHRICADFRYRKKYRRQMTVWLSDEDFYMVSNRGYFRGIVKIYFHD